MKMDNEKAMSPHAGGLYRNKKSWENYIFFRNACAMDEQQILIDSLSLFCYTRIVRQI
jgi:hypothetical protein